MLSSHTVLSHEWQPTENQNEGLFSEMAAEGASAGALEGTALLFATQLDGEKPPDSWLRVHIDRPQRLACGHFHYLALSADGSVYSWGRGPLGVLGHGSEDDEPKERLVEALDGQGIRDIAAGPYHSAALTPDGRLFTWGWMPFGISAQGKMEETFSHVPRPVKLSAAITVRGLACGCFATACWDDHAQLYTWGRGESGQLGHGNTASVAAPKAVEALMGVRVGEVAFGGVQTAAGSTGFMLVRSESGLVFSCGSPARGRLGRRHCLYEEDDDNAGGGAGGAGGEPMHHAVPGEVLLGANGELLCASLAAGDNHAVCVTPEGHCFVWGANESGVLGRAAYEEDAELPQELEGLPPVSQVVCASHSSALVTEAGALLLLGGDPAVPDKPRLAGLPGVIQAVFGGGFHLGVLLGGEGGAGAASGAAGVADRQGLRSSSGGGGSSTLMLPSSTEGSGGGSTRDNEQRRRASGRASGLNRGHGNAGAGATGGGGGMHGDDEYDYYSHDTSYSSTTDDVASEVTARPDPLLPAPALLREQPEFADAVAPELAELLLADPAGAPPLQLRHELRLLRDLLAAERAKLQGVTDEDRRVSEEHSRHLHPSDDTWTDKEKLRGESMGDPEVYTTVLGGGGAEAGDVGGVLHIARSSSIVLEDRSGYRGRN